MRLFAFKKEEKLCSKIKLDRLFAEGTSLFVFPFKILFVATPANEHDEAPVEVVFIVPKRTIKHAVKRNLIRRRAREAYRLNKNPFVAQLTERNMSLTLAFIYIDKEEKDFKDVEKGMKKALKKLEEKVSHKSTPI
jgi:ribonuclease P protein component